MKRDKIEIIYHDLLFGHTYTFFPEKNRYTIVIPINVSNVHGNRDMITEKSRKGKAIVS